MKKFLAILLSVVLLVPALAVAVMADGEEITLIPEDATFAIVDNGSYTFEDGVLVRDLGGDSGTDATDGTSAG